MSQPTRNRLQDALAELEDFETSQYINDEHDRRDTHFYTQNIRRQIIEAYLPKAPGEKLVLDDPEVTNSVLKALADMDKAEQFKAKLNLEKRKHADAKKSEEEANQMMGGVAEVIKAAMSQRQERARQAAQRTTPPTPDPHQLSKVEINQIAVDNVEHEELDVTAFTKGIIAEGLDPRFVLDEEGNIVPRNLDEEEKAFKKAHGV